MKICTITCNNADNHGARLQTMALAKFLTDAGHQVEVIDYYPHYVWYMERKWYNPGLDFKEWVRFFKNFNIRCRSLKRHAQFTDFSARYLPLTKHRYLNVEDLRANDPGADVLVCGSDQIWNPTLHNGSDPSFYLNFGSADVRRISYAASFAVDTLSDAAVAFARERLKRLDAISVRESSALDVLNVLGYHGVQVIDPVFLLDRGFWDTFSDFPQPEEDYLVVYDFERSRQMANMVRRVARLRQLKIYSVTPYKIWYADKDFGLCSPTDFVGLIRNAKCVVSNSFHGSAFALIFGKDFYVVNRNDGLNVRMRDLLTHYGMPERIVDKNTPDSVLTAPIDYGKITPKIQQDIRYSQDWLLSNLV